MSDFEWLAVLAIAILALLGYATCQSLLAIWEMREPAPKNSWLIVYSDEAKQKWWQKWRA
jgi:hypothetical protein